MTIDRYSKKNRWYYEDIDGYIKPESRKLLEDYSQIPPENVDAHIYKMRDALWSHAPYPCVGEFKFMTLNLPSHPQYQHVLDLLSKSLAEGSTSSPVQLLDLGCCVAQELRSLTHAGIPSTQLYGSDLCPGYLVTSYELFNDKESFRGTLVPANVFSEDVFEKAWEGWAGRFGIVHAGLFLHLFNRAQQIAVCKKIVRLMSKEKGSLFLGEMVGCENGGQTAEKKGITFFKREERREQFLHDVKTFEEMWGEVAEKTGTAGMWKVEGAFEKRAQRDGGEGSQARSFFTGPGIGWLKFSVEKI